MSIGAYRSYHFSRLPEAEIRLGDFATPETATVRGRRSVTSYGPTDLMYKSMGEGDIVPDLSESWLLADKVETLSAQFYHDVSIGGIG